jgi:plastocyanin
MAVIARVLAAAVLAAAPLSLALAAEVEITINEHAFTPATLTVAKGTTVVWTNLDDTPHNVAANGKQFKSPALDTKDSFRWTFSEAGSFPYYCTLHPFMKGTVTVTP